VIPAFNEEARIEHTLRTLLADARPGEFEVVVVANGCSDATAGAARSVPGVSVVETPVGSKTHALNLGDHVVTAFPRVYLDADVSLDTRDLRRLVATLTTTRDLVASPMLLPDLSGVSRWVQAFYRVWRELPYFETQIGGGVYGVSRSGRSRWREFPDITADDAFVRLHFGPEERVVVRECAFTIRPPRDLASLVRIKTRSRRGNLELARRFPVLRREDAPRNRRFLLGLMGSPRAWPDLGVYLWVCTRTVVSAYLKHLTNRHGQWERDESSRGCAPLEGSAA
jgi:glycosyltransferase involved in cell wall biosynthesis